MTNATLTTPATTTASKTSSRVRRLGDDLDLEWLRAAGSGSMRIRVGDGDVVVRVDGDLDVLEVQAPVLVGVVHTDALATDLTGLSATLPAATLAWVSGQVVVATDLPLVFLDHDELLEACITIRNVAAHFRARLQQAHGGH